MAHGGGGVAPTKLNPAAPSFKPPDSSEADTGVPAEFKAFQAQLANEEREERQVGKKSAVREEEHPASQGESGSPALRASKAPRPDPTPTPPRAAGEKDLVRPAGSDSEDRGRFSKARRLDSDGYRQVVAKQKTKPAVTSCQHPGCTGELALHCMGCHKKFCVVHRREGTDRCVQCMPERGIATLKQVNDDSAKAAREARRNMAKNSGDCHVCHCQVTHLDGSSCSKCGRMVHSSCKNKFTSNCIGCDPVLKCPGCRKSVSNKVAVKCAGTCGKLFHPKCLPQQDMCRMCWFDSGKAAVFNTMTKIQKRLESYSKEGHDIGPQFLNSQNVHKRKIKQMPASLLAGLLSFIDAKVWPHPTELVPFGELIPFAGKWRLKPGPTRPFAFGYCPETETDGVTHEEHFVTLTFQEDGSVALLESQEPHPDAPHLLSVLGVPEEARHIAVKGTQMASSGLTCAEAVLDNFLQLKARGDVGGDPLLRPEDFSSTFNFAHRVANVWRQYASAEAVAGLVAPALPAQPVGVCRSTGCKEEAEVVCSVCGLSLCSTHFVAPGCPRCLRREYDLSSSEDEPEAAGKDRSENDASVELVEDEGAQASAPETPDPLVVRAATALREVVQASQGDAERTAKKLLARLGEERLGDVIRVPGELYLKAQEMHQIPDPTIARVPQLPTWPTPPPEVVRKPEDDVITSCTAGVLTDAAPSRVAAEVGYQSEHSTTSERSFDEEEDDVPAPTPAPTARDGQEPAVGTRAPDAPEVNPAAAPKRRVAKENLDQVVGNSTLTRPQQAKKKKSDFRRAKHDRTAQVVEGSEQDKMLIDQGFHPALECLRLQDRIGAEGRRALPMTEEAAKKISPDVRLQKLLQLEYLVIPRAERLQKALKLNYRRSHLYLLKDVLKEVRDAKQMYPDVATAMTDALERLKKSREWAVTTLLTKSQTLYGALERLDQYANLPGGNPEDGGRLKIKLSLPEFGSVWKDSSKKWILDVCGYEPSVKPVTLKGVQSIVKKCELSVACLIILSWVTTGRPETWKKVEWSDLTWTLKKDAIENGGKTEDGYEVMVTFRHHKTAAKIGAMRIPTLLPVEWVEKLERWKAVCPGNKFIFSSTSWPKLREKLLLSLRNEEWGGDMEWESRGLRRGSLTTMAEAGVTYDDLKLFSLHKDDHMVTRYLQGGLHAAERHDRARKAAQNLIRQPSTSGPDTQ